ncbi:PDR/VanB family oxidoreductase [Mesorhizobium hawassense]|nr:PDR/VanB family oxidoreductase [Mesorhizobium hawassense]
MKLIVAGVHVEPGDVRVIELKHHRRPLLPAFEPGSHVDVHLPIGKVRQYSLCGDPEDLSRYTIAVKRENGGRGGSAWIHDQLTPGAELPVTAPRNHFPLKESDGPVLLLAGGIGITPIFAMARALWRQGKPFELHYFARSRSLAPLLGALEKTISSENLRLHLDDQVETRQDLEELLSTRPSGAQLYYCGPPGFMAAVALASEDWPDGTVNFEAFQPLVQDDTPPEPFMIVLRNGAVVSVPADKSALSAIRAAGVLLMASCENGVCGTCECGYLEGQPIHRDAVLPSNARSHRFIPCVSRATGVLKLDL